MSNKDYRSVGHLSSIGRSDLDVRPMCGVFREFGNFCLEQARLVREGLHPNQAAIDCIAEERRARESELQQQYTLRGKGRNGLPSDPDAIVPILKGYYSWIVSNGGRACDLSDATASAIQRAAFWLAYPDTAPFLILSGSVGSGKTTLLKAVALALRNAPDSRIAALELPQKFINPPRIAEVSAEGVWERYNPQEDSLHSGSMGALCCADFLMLDDLGLEQVIKQNYGTKYSPVRMLLSERAEVRMAPTMITTNLKGREEWIAHCGERLYDRICEVSDMVILNQSSFRQTRTWRSTQG